MGAQLDYKNGEGETALHLAAVSGHLDTVKWLVANSADVSAVNGSGETALQRAETYRQTAVVGYLETCARDLRNPTSQYAMTYHSSSTSSNNRCVRHR